MKLLFVAGARPNFVKLSPLVNEAKRAGVQYTILHTGQHYDNLMSGIFFDELKMPRPDIDLGISGGTNTEVTGRMTAAIGKHLEENHYDQVIVMGDTNSTLAAAIAARQTGHKLAHVEAGLRSYDRRMPEELNRTVTDHISDVLFVTEPAGLTNLKKEGITEHVYMTGNVMIDCMIQNRELIEAYPLKYPKQTYALLTLHRVENVENPEIMQTLMQNINKVAEILPIVFPLHPRTRRVISELNIVLHEQIRTLEPAGYIEMQSLIANSKLVMTDSGGIQEETSWWKIPCLTLRENTERPITIEKGTNTLVGSDTKKLLALVDSILKNGYKKVQKIDGWDGKAAKRIIKILQNKI